MKKIHYFIVAFLFVICFSIVFLFKNDSEIDVNKVSTEVFVSSEMLTEFFITNEKKANKKYKNKVIEINGVVEKISYKNHRKTILLNGNNNGSNVMCDIQLSTEKKVDSVLLNKKVTVKGVCKGFLNDVIILNCVLINTENDEKN